MADLGVSHLSFGQADIEPARAQPAAGIFAVKTIVHRRGREERGVAIRFATRATAGVDPPAVANQKQDGTRHGQNFPATARTHKRLLALTSPRRGFYIGLVKWRNQLLALFCLIVFFAFGVFYFRYWVIQKPFGIILFIGEGLDAQTLAAARLAAGGPEGALAIDSLGYTALLKNRAADAATPTPPPRPAPSPRA